MSGNNDFFGAASRRDWLSAGSVGCLGALASGLSHDAQAANSGNKFGKAKSCILIFLLGGHPQHETFDPKPDASAELRGPFRPIHTNVPGIDFCELLPRTARIAHRLCVLRSLATDDNTHGSSAYYYYTGTNQVKGGLPLGKTDRKANRMIDWPSIASVVGKLKPSDRSPFSAALLPELLLNNPGYLFAGQDGGFMGRGWDPQVFQCDPTRKNYQIDSLGLATDVSRGRLSQRQQLRSHLNQKFVGRHTNSAVKTFSRQMDQAFGVLMSGPARNAFDLSREKDSLRDLYGRHKFGQSLLLARRLVSAGVRFVQVNWPREPGDLSVGNPGWDTHFDNAGRCRDVLCPPFDLGFSTFIEDMQQRGLLEETLVVVLGDFGRTPKINANGGRDHWGPVMSGILAGAGVSTAQVIGASDRNGAYPIERRIEPQEVSATIFHLMGIDPHTHIEVAGRPFKITSGRVIHEAIGSGPISGHRRKATGEIGRLPNFQRGTLSNSQFAEGPMIAGDIGQATLWQSLPAWRRHSAPTLSVASRVRRKDGFVAQIGVGIGQQKFSGGMVKKGARGLLAQEFYNPRPGRYEFEVRVSAIGDAKSKQLWRESFACKIALVRFTDLSRNFRKIAILMEQSFVPSFNADPITVTVSRMMKDQQGGAGELLKGIGAVVIVENKSSGAVRFDAPVSLIIEQASGAFTPRR